MASLLRCPAIFRIALLGSLSFIFYTSLAQKKETKKHTHADSLLARLEQTDLIDFLAFTFKPKYKKTDRTATEGDVLFSVIPVAPAGGGKVTVSAINASFYLGPRSQTNLSTIYFYPYTNFKGSYGLLLSPNIWFDKNQWNGVGDFRFVHSGSPEYGLGANTSLSTPYDIVYEHVRTYFTAHTRLVGFLYLGAGYDMDRFFNVKENVKAELPPSDFSMYGAGNGPETTSSGITINILRDNRKNQVNPTNGFYTAAIFRSSTKGMGSTYNWSSFYLESRKYISFSKVRHKVFAARGIYWATYGDVPYFNLPSTFQDLKSTAGRGYAVNRFRGKQMIFAEAEYRFDITHHGFLGGVVFANAQTFTETNEHFAYVQPAVGFGLRMKFNRNSDTNIALDFAWGKDGFNFNFNLGEIF